MSPEVAVRRLQRLLEVSLWWSPVCPVQLRSGGVAFWFWILGCSLSSFIWTVLSVHLLNLSLFFGSSDPGKSRIGRFTSKVAFFCGVFGFITPPTRWVDGSLFSVTSVGCIVWVGIVGNLVVGVIVCLNTVVIFDVAGNICVVLGCVFCCLRRHWFRQWSGFLQWWQEGLGSSEFGLAACCITVFICSSSGTSKTFFSAPFQDSRQSVCSC